MAAYPRRARMEIYSESESESESASMKKKVKIDGGVESKVELLEIAKKLEIFHEYSRTVLTPGFHKFCEGINWDPLHIIMFLSKHLNAEALFDSFHRFCFKGRHDIHQLQSLLLSYLEDFVICKACACTKIEPLKRDAFGNGSSLATCKQCGTQRKVPTAPFPRSRLVQ